MSSGYPPAVMEDLSVSVEEAGLKGEQQGVEIFLDGDKSVKEWNEKK